MDRWKYMVLPLNPTNPAGLEDLLNRLGQQGWELIAVAEGTLIMKQPTGVRIPPAF